VHYLPADGTSPQTNGVNDHGDESTTMVSPPPSYHAPNQANSGDESSSNVDSRTAEVLSAVGDPHYESRDSRPQLSREELLERLSEANATISRLQREGEEQGLRRRKEDASESKGLASGGVSMGVPSHQVQGMSVQTAAILCLVVFLLTYILF
jgi:hypothetical protein